MCKYIPPSYSPNRCYPFIEPSDVYNTPLPQIEGGANVGNYDNDSPRLVRGDMTDFKIPPPDDENEDFQELNELADKGELTQENLQSKLNEYHKAFAEEFETKTKAAPENVEQYTRDFFKENIHMAAAQIVWLAGNAESESVRLRACSTIVSEALQDARASGDPIKDIINGLKAKKTQGTPTSN